MESSDQSQVDEEVSPELQKLKSLIEKITIEPAAINTKDEENNTPLHLAIKHVDEEVIRALLTYKPDCNALDKNHYTPLHYVKTVAVAKLLLENGAAIDAVGSGKMTPLHMSLKNEVEEVAAYLIQHGADVNMKGESDQSPLHLCTSSRIAKLLLDAGAEIDAGDEYLRTPLHTAVIHNRLDIVLILLKRGADVSSTRDDRRTPLHDAKSVAMVKLLLDNGALVNARDDQGRSPLHMAVEIGDPGDFREIVKLLWQSGVKVSIQDSQGKTAVHFAVERGKYEAVLVLLHKDVPFFTKTGLDWWYPSENSFKIGRLLDASLKLRAAGLRLTEENLKALAYNKAQNCFHWSTSNTGFLYSNQMVSDFVLKCQQELEAWKNHKVTDSLSLDYILRTDTVNYLSNKHLVNTMQTLDYGMYPIYESFMMHKFAKDKLIVSALESFKKLLECGKTNVSSLPDEIVLKILVLLDSVDIKKLVSCDYSIKSNGSCQQAGEQITTITRGR